MKARSYLIAVLTAVFVAAQLKGASTARTLIVFPFANQSTRADLGWISEGFATILSSRLESANRYVLGREERNAAYAQLELAPGTSPTLASVYKAAEILGVDWAVLGNFSVESNHLTAHAQLLDVRSLKLSPPLEATGELADLVDLQTQLAWRLLAAHDPDFTVGPEDEFRHRFPDIRLDAFENYIRGILSNDEAGRVQFLTEADKRNPRDHQPAFLLGRFYFDQKNYSKAVPWLRKLDEKDANFPESLFLLGVSEYFLGHEAAAEKAFATLSKQIPLNEVSNNLGVMEARRHDYPGALASFERAYQADPSDPDFCFNLGVCLWYLKRYNDSAQYLKEAITLDDEDLGAHTLLDLVLGKMGDSNGQRLERKWLIDHEGVSIVTVAERDNLPQTRIKKHYDGRAFRLLALAVRNAEEESLVGKPAAQHGAVHLANGKKLMAEGRVAEAERELTEAVALIPDVSEAHLSLAQAFEAESKNQEAAAELEASLKLKSDPAAHASLARVYLSLNRLDAAREQAQAVLSVEPTNRDAQQVIEQIRARTPAAGRTP